MGIYDGETVRIKATVTDFDDNPVTPVQASAGTVTLLDSSGNYVFQDITLNWNSTLDYWYYDWQDALPGTFTAVCTFSGSGFTVFDYGLVRVRPLKVIPTGDPTSIVN